MSTIRFRVVPPIDRPHEPVFLTGGIGALGNWDPARALKLEWHPPHHTGSIEADTGVHFEYKVTRGNWESEAVDAWGHVPHNARHEVWLDATLSRTVADWKDRYSGRLTHDRVHSRILAGERELTVWLPPSYGRGEGKRFPLVLLYDGANVFDPATSAVSNVDWAADEWVDLMSREGVMPEAVVVGVCHPEGFSEDNATMRDFDLSPELGGAAFAQFVVSELLPYLDQHYRTDARAEARMLGGAGLGALNAFHVALRHPGFFGKFACLSTSFEDVSQSLPDQSALLRALEAEPALDAGARMYFDHGDQGLDECYAGYHALLAGLLREKGWKEGAEFTVRSVPGGAHTELSWRARFGDALRFLFR
ncbi:MAG: hypothetical protein KGR46_00905 [Verrucomicrobia bacterium]|nr:hypothetical protein [Verrucomicrobiota bacterium]